MQLLAHCVSMVPKTELKTHYLILKMSHCKVYDLSSARYLTYIKLRLSTNQRSDCIARSVNPKKKSPSFLRGFANNLHLTPLTHI